MLGNLEYAWRFQIAQSSRKSYEIQSKRSRSAVEENGEKKEEEEGKKEGEEEEEEDEEPSCLPKYDPMSMFWRCTMPGEERYWILFFLCVRALSGILTFDLIFVLVVGNVEGGDERHFWESYQENIVHEP